MTKIKNYPLDLEVNGGDKWIGTDSASLAKLTKNFTPDNLAKYYNDKEVVESVNQMRFFYDTVDPGDQRANGSFSFPTEVGATVPFSSISNLVFSKYTMGSDAVNNFMTDIVNSIIIIQKADNPDIYAFYALNGYEVDPSNPDFYNVALSFESGNGSVEEDQDYLVSLIQFAGAAGVQTILGSEFIDSTLTGVGEVTISLSATGTPSNLTGLRGDNTWGTLGLEAINENGRQTFGSTDPPIGWRLIGRDPSLYGNIGEDAIDFSTGYFQNESLPFGGSITNSPQIGSTGPGSFTLGGTVENNSSNGVVFGGSNVLNGGPNIEPTYFVGGVVLGQYNQSYGLNYYNFTSGYKNLIGDRTQQSWSDAGFPYPYPVQYWSGQIGMYNQMPSGYASVQLGYGLLSGGPFCTTVGIANDDVTLSIAQNVVNERNALNPRFIVGCGTYAGTTQNPSVGVRQNGFVVMSDGTATFPILTNAMIDAANDDSAVTKGWVNSGPALTSEQVRIEVKNTSGVTLLKGTPVYITGTVGATIRAEVAAADASDPAKMPSVGVLLQDLINNEDGFAVTGGFLTNITTDPIDGLTPTENDTVYVKAGGGLTLTKPIGSNLIQNIAKVGKVSGGNAGSLVISSILRTNDVPNLTTGKIWVGTAANTAESGVVYLDEGNGRMGIGTTSPTTKLTIGDGTAVDRIRTYYSDGTYTDVLGYGIEFNRGASYLRPTGDNTQTLYIGSGANTWEFLNLTASTTTFTTESNGEAMRITNTGNVGIGTTSPSEKLDIEGSGSTNLEINNTLNSISLTLGAQATAARLTAGTGNRLGFGANNTADQVTISTSGNVGIGTTSPAVEFHVQGNGTGIPGRTFARFENTSIDSAAAAQFYNGDGNYAFFQYSGSGYVIGEQFIVATQEDKPVSFQTNSKTLSGGSAPIIFSPGGYNNEKVRFAANGNVGIGTTSPSSKLDVEGRVDFASDIRLRGQNTSLNLGVVRLYVDATNNFFIDPGNAGTALSTFKSTGAVQLGNYGSGTFTGTATQRLAVDSSGNVIEIPIGSGPVDGSGTANYVTKWSDADTITDSVIYDDGTNVGIGTTNPATKLEVSGITTIRKSGVATPHADTDLLVTDATAAGSTAQIQILGGNAGNSHLYFSDTDNYSQGGIQYLHASDSMNIRVNATTAITIDSSRNVGIGTTSPSAKLHVDAGTAEFKVQDAFNGGFNGAQITGTNAALGFIGGNLDEYILTTLNDGSFRFYNPGGAGYALTLTNTGQFGIGTTNPQEKLDISAGNIRLDDNREITWATTDANVGRVRITGSEAADIITFATDNSEKMRLTNTGLGIGTTSPSVSLDVNGSARALNVYVSNNIIHDGDTNTFIGFDTDAIKLWTAGNERLRVNSSGNVGIGTTGPSYLLHVDGGTIGSNVDSTANNTSRQVNMTSANTTGMNAFTSYSTNTDVTPDFLGKYGYKLEGGTATANKQFQVYVSDAVTPKMVVNGSGNVGIGTTSPTTPLHVVGIAQVVESGNSAFYGGNYVRLFNDQNFNIRNVGGAIIANISTSGNSYFNGGNVGIGTTSPAAKLDVNGGVRVADDAAVASATNVGTLRYRTSGNNSYVDMCMQTGAATYAWVNIVQNNW